MPDDKPKPKRRSWLRRTLWFVFISLVVLFIAAASGVWWAHSHRTELVNHFLKKAGPLNGNITGVDFDRAGNIEVRGLELVEPESGVRLLRIPKLKGRVDWSTLAAGNVGGIRLEEPEIMLDEKALTNLLNQPADAAGGSIIPPQGIRVGSIAIEKAAITLRLADGTSAHIIASYHAKDVAVKANGECTTGDQELLIEDGRLNVKEDSASPVALKRLHMKGRIHEGFIEIDLFTCEEPELRLKPALFAMFAPKQKTADTQKPQSATAQPAFPIKGLRVASISLRDAQAGVAGFQDGNSSGFTLPDASGTFSYEASALEWPFDGVPVTGAQRLHLNKLDLHPPDNSGHARCDSANITLSTAGAHHPWRVEKCDLDGLDLNWTEAFRKWLLPPAKNETPPPPSASDTAPWSVKLDEVNLHNANVRIADTALLDYTLDTKATLQVRDVTLDNNGWHSAQTQSLTVTDGRLVFPNANATKNNKPFFELPQGELIVCPDAWNQDMHVEKLTLVKPVVRLRDGNTPWLKPAAPQLAAEVQAFAEKKTEHPWWELIDFSEALIEDGSADVLTEDAKPLDAHATINLTTEIIAGGRRHRVTLGDLEVRLPTLSKLPTPIVRGATIEGVGRIPQAWLEKELDEVTLRGASVEAGQALLKYFEAPPAPKTEGKPSDNVSKQPEEPTVAQPWICGRVSVEDSFVTLENVVPGMSSLRFGISFEAENTPLTPDDLADNVKPQRVELANLRIPSPLLPSRSVAELDSVFVDFTLRGLFHKEVDKIEIVSPTLMVGEDLFWYVEFYRKYVAQGMTPNAKEPRIAANDEELEFGVANAVMDGEVSAANSAWSIRTLQVHSGKLVLAPKGKPLPGFRTPFPFSFTSEVKSGTLEADFDIPSDNYEWEDLKLRFEGLHGKVVFNLPMKSRDNNLTETFDVDRIRFKDLRTGKAFLSVTYDKNGIYGQFGAEAYEGYIKGGFDVYLDDSFNWDLWVNGDNVRTTELTEKLTPGVFFMDGKVAVTVIAQGDVNEVYQADGKYHNVTPGKITIKSMNQLIGKLPPEWAGWKNQMTTIGLEAMRDFDYDQSTASFRFYGREGKADLSFKGPTGSRNILINVFDHRWKTDPPHNAATRRADATP